MDPAGAGPLQSRIEALQQLRNSGRALGKLSPSTLGRIRGCVQRQHDCRQIGRAFQLSLAAYGHQRSRPDGFGHAKTLRRGCRSPVSPGLRQVSALAPASATV